MKKWLLSLAVLALASCAQKTDVSSPDGSIVASLRIRDGRAEYSVSVDGKNVISPSPMGLCAKGTNLADGFRVKGSRRSSVDEQWSQPWGENKRIRDKHNSLIVDLENREGVCLALEFRAFDDGVAFRYIYDVPSVDTVEVTDELTEFRFTEDAVSWSIPASFDTYEYLYRKMNLSEVENANTPFTLVRPDGLHLSVHEAALVDFPEMVLRRDSALCFKADLSPLKKGEVLKARVSSGFKTPWRTLQVSRDAVGLVNSSMILNLNDPCKIEDTSWIKPMKYIGVWWGMHLGIENWQGKYHGATTRRAMEYIDFAAENNIQGVLFEGWNDAWRGSAALADFDFTKAAPDFDIQKVLSYARKKGVDFIAHNETGGNYTRFDEQLCAALDWDQSNGIHALKTGYAGGGLVGGVPRHSQTGINHFHRVVREAASRQIMVDGHEVEKPTGLQRTWPNYMTRECVRGMEYNGWSSGNPPSHHEILPYTRLLGGPVDYTPGVFDILYENIKGKPQVREWGQPGTNCRVHTTLCKQIANWVILYSPMQMACDLIENYKGHPAFRFFKDFDADCDVSRALQGEVGEYIALYRRASDRYFYAATTDENARTLTQSLDFLSPGVKYRATIYADAPDADWKTNPCAYQITERIVDSSDTLTIRLAPGGGQAISFIPELSD